MITENNKFSFWFIFLIIFFLTGCDMDNEVNTEVAEPSFNVYGDKELINKLIINVRSIKKWNNSQAYTESRTQTLLKDGKQFIVNNQADSYEIYFSYGNQVGVLTFNNDVYRPLNGSSDRINELHVYKNDKGQVYLQHFATKEYKEKKQGFKSNPSLPFDDYALRHPRLEENYKDLYKEKFYGDFPADKQVFRRDPLSREVIVFFKTALPLEKKKKFGIFYSDLEKMDLPNNELKQIQDYYKKEDPQMLY